MPQHPPWRGVLSAEDRDLLAEPVTVQPKTRPSWGIDDVRKPLQVLVADESTLPLAPKYRIERIDDLILSGVRRARRLLLRERALPRRRQPGHSGGAAGGLRFAHAAAGEADFGGIARW